MPAEKKPKQSNGLMAYGRRLRALLWPPRPWMTGAEVRFLRRHLRRSDSVLEWGAGNSTLYFSKYVRRYVSIEHSPVWIASLQPRLRRNTTLIEVPVSAPYTPKIENGSEPQPAKLKVRIAFEGTYAQFKDYVEIVDTLPGPFDVVIIDGRARTSCAARLLPHIGRETRVFVHDFKRYDEILTEHYELVDQVEQLALLRKREGASFAHA